MTDASALRRNLAGYVHYQTARNAIAWLPVFFLYMSSVLSVDEAIVLESIYYAAVVGLEVPSGYASDRLGRRPTLVLAMAAWGTASVVFALSSSFEGFAAAQVLMAVGMALNSGTDEALLFDTLSGLDERERYLEIEARAQARARLATGVAALVGGALAMVDYRWAYVVSAASAGVALVFALRMYEPPHPAAAESPVRQLRAVLSRLGDRVLLWLMLFAVAMTVFDHVAYMFIQPYLELLRLPALAGTGSTPLISGVVTAAVLGVAALASRATPRIEAAIGPRAALVVAMLGDGVVIVGMGLFVHPAILGLLVLRAVPPAVWQPIAHGIAHPKVPSRIRATFFSLESLAGRLAFAGSLALAAAMVGDLETITAPALRGVLLGFAVALAVVWVVAVLTSRVVPGRTHGQRAT